MRPKLLTILILVVIIVAASWAVFRPGFFRVHDYVHAARIAEMTRALEEGHFPVRWSANFGYGFGMPLFEFYAPLPFYIGSLFYWLGLDIIVTLKLLWVLSSVGILLGGYFLGKKLTNAWGGVALAALLTLAPYRAVNLFVRGALAEAWGMLFLPWILLGLVLIIQRQRWGWLLLSLSAAGLVLSHNLTAFIFLPLSVLFGIAYWLAYKPEKAHTRSILVESIGGYMLAMGLSAFYILPALVEKDQTQISQILSGYFHYSQHFLYIRQFITPFWGYGGSQWGPDDGISFFLGWGFIVGLGMATVAVLTVVWQLLRKHTRFSFRQFSTVWLPAVLAILFGTSLFMTLQRSAIIWDSLQPLSFIQFPWRWLSASAVFGGLLIITSIAVLKSKRVMVIAYLVITALLVLINWRYFRPESYMDNPDELYYTDPDRIRTSMSSILPDYIPVGMDEGELIPPDAVFIVPEGLQEQTEVIVNYGHQKLIRTAFTSPAVLNFNLADFPGWQVEIDGQQVNKEPGQSGTFAVTVPAGSHLVGAYFGNSPIRQVSDIVSLISVLVLLYLVLPMKKTAHD